MNTDAVEAMMDSAEAMVALADSIRLTPAPAPVVNVVTPPMPVPVVNVSAPVVNIPAVEPRPRKYKIAITSRDYEGRWKTAEIEAL